jgi:hypothetical protein
MWCTENLEGADVESMLDAESEMQDLFIHRQQAQSFRVYISIIKFRFIIDAGRIYTPRCPADCREIVCPTTPGFFLLVCYCFDFSK